MSDWSRCRITALMDSGVFNLPANPPVVTKEGEPWARWANLGSNAGWYVLGTRKPKLLEEHGFWERVWMMACEVGNGNVDATHCIGPGVLSVGGMAVTVTWGHAQALLAECLRAEPALFVRHMAPVTHATGVFLEAGDRPFSEKLRHVTRGSLVDPNELVDGIRGGAAATYWTSGQKRIGKLWVVCVSNLLRHDCMDAAQVAFCRGTLPELMSGALKLRISWPTNGIEDAWMFTREQQALWALAMVLTIEDLLQAETLLVAQVQTEPVDAKASLGNILAHCEGDDFARTFTARVQNTVKRVQELFEFSLEGG
jgi:hypothetical protein